ncbi:torsin-1A-like [Ptychodera flava]|uniref:torsin-1A-like n=1 Tax=Ptychodera flava TaxID=63121 RepID=UPI00396A8683
MHRSMSLTHNLDKCETRLNKSEGIFVTWANREQLSVSGYSLSRSLSVNRVETANSKPEMLPGNASLRPSFQRSQSVNAVRTPTVYSVNARMSYPGRSLTGSTSVKRHKQKKESGTSTDVCEEFHKSGNSVKDLSQEKQSHRCSRFICWLLFPVMVTLLLGTLNAAYNVDLQAKLQGRTRFIASEALNLSTTGLKENFQEMVFGQHIVTEALPQIITDYISSNADPNPLVLSFHGWIGTGKTFVTDLIMEQLFKKQNLVKCTHRFVSSYDFPLQDRHDQYSARLMQVINSTALNHCKVILIIFDEADAIPLGLIPTLVALFKDTAQGAGFGKGIYILESNLFGQEINRFLIHHVLQGKSLESVTASEITDFLHYTAVRQVDFQKPDMEGDDEFDSHRALLGHQQLESVIDYKIPFLPLTRDAVKQCVQRDLKQKRHEVTSSIVDQITEQLQFFPSNLRLFSVTGCKKVSPHVDLVVG